MCHNQLISDPCTKLKKRAQRSDDSILLCHRDDVVGTNPEEHLMSAFERMRTSLCSTDVVVLCHESDPVNFWYLEITKTSKGFEVQNSTDLVESLFNLDGLEKLQNLQPIPLDIQQCWTSRQQLLWVVMIIPTVAQPSANSSSYHLADLTCNFAIQQLSTQVLDPTAENKRSETVHTISQRHATHLSSS